MQGCRVVRAEDDRRLEVLLRDGSEELPAPTARRDDVQDGIGWVSPDGHDASDGRCRGSHELSDRAQLGTDGHVTADAGTGEDLPVFGLHCRTDVSDPEPRGEQLRVQGAGGPGDQIGIGDPGPAAGGCCIVTCGHAVSLPSRGERDRRPGHPAWA